MKMRCLCSLSCVQLFVAPWTAPHQAPLPMGFSRQKYWSGLSFPSPDLPDPEIEPESPGLQGDFYHQTCPNSKNLLVCKMRSQFWPLLPC